MFTEILIIGVVIKFVVIMDYEKKNKDAIKAIKQALRQLATNGVPVGNMIKAIKDIEEKYAESEDEKIRKTICNCVKWFGLDFCFFKDVSQEECLAWLEKQGEQNTVVVIPKFRVGDVIRHKGSTAEYTIESISGECYHGKGWGLHISCDNDYELVEQKPTDKVETNFKVGDWVVCIGDVQQILSIDANGVCFASGKRVKNKYISNYHLWTIQDAKEGDLLADNYGIYIFDRFDEYDKRCYICKGAYQYSQKEYENEHMLCSVEAHPTTKEQRDLLFRKMHEAGYEWDAEKKELKKIEPTPAWSGEDERMFDAVIADIQFTQKAHNHEVNQIVYEREIDWLKSLKDRYTWKPSDEQMEALLKLEEMHVLEHEKNQENAHLYMMVKSIREQLLKLREE